jgi:hypothetical protein
LKQGPQELASGETSAQRAENGMADMLRKALKIFRRHPLLSGTFLLALALTLFFGISALSRAIYWAQHQRDPVAPWMTVGYVARSWGLHPKEIDERANLPHPPGHPMTLREIASERGVPVQDIITLVEKTVDDLLAEQAQKHD